MNGVPKLWLLLALLGCAPYRPPAEVPLAVAARGPIGVVRVENAAESAVFFVVRAGSAYDPPSREGLAFAVANALARRAGAEVRVGPELVEFRVLSDRAAALAEALDTPLSSDVFEVGRAAGLSALHTRECRQLAEALIQGWAFAGHPYGHPTAGRLSVLPTLQLPEAESFRLARYVRNGVRVGVDGWADVEPLLGRLGTALSRSPTPAARPKVVQPPMVAEAAVDSACIAVAPAVLPSWTAADAAAASVLSTAVGGSPLLAPRVDPYLHFVQDLPGDGFERGSGLEANPAALALAVPFETARAQARSAYGTPTALRLAGEALLTSASRVPLPSAAAILEALDALRPEDLSAWAVEHLAPGRAVTLVVTPDASAWRHRESGRSASVLDSEELLR